MKSKINTLLYNPFPMFSSNQDKQSSIVTKVQYSTDVVAVTKSLSRLDEAGICNIRHDLDCFWKHLVDDTSSNYVFKNIHTVWFLFYCEKELELSGHRLDALEAKTKNITLVSNAVRLLKIWTNQITNIEETHNNTSVFSVFIGLMFVFVTTIVVVVLPKMCYLLDLICK